MNITDTSDLTKMVDGYLGAALWTYLHGDEGESPFGGDEDARAIFTLEALVTAVTVCQAFVAYVGEQGDDATDLPTAIEWNDASRALVDMDPVQAGHDLWLTAEGHGVGFWDRGLGVAGKRLTDAAQAFPMSITCERTGDDEWTGHLS